MVRTRLLSSTSLRPLVDLAEQGRTRVALETGRQEIPAPFGQPLDLLGAGLDQLLRPLELVGAVVAVQLLGERDCARRGDRDYLYGGGGTDVIDNSTRESS